MVDVVPFTSYRVEVEIKGINLVWNLCWYVLDLTVIMLRLNR